MNHDEAPLANVVTLGTKDFQRLRDFYRALGWQQSMDTDDYAVFELRGLVLALFPSDKLASDGRAEPDRGRRGIRFTIGILVPTPEDVDRTVERARDAGATVTKDPVDAEHFTGRSAYFADPEGNYWEVAWAPDDNPVIAAAKRASGVTG